MQDQCKTPAEIRPGESRRGGREARRVIRTDRKSKMLPALKRNLPLSSRCRPIRSSEIDNASMSILEDVGVLFRDRRRSRTGSGRGPSRDGDRVHLDRGLVRELIATIPSSFTYHARNPENNLPFGGTHSIFVPMTGAPFLRDLDDVRRRPTIADLGMFHKLATCRRRCIPPRTTSWSRWILPSATGTCTSPIRP